ncbi:hypothetical protein BC834DRAFT_850610 [Gloeopeniophorella convolvens]|nr:hypothetical protein BC834DRAFT_850610 [Gloeopeniophorella convolvens]
MFIAVVGTRFSGKSSLETYLTGRNFVPVRILGQGQDEISAVEHAEVGCLCPLLTFQSQSHIMSSRSLLAITTNSSLSEMVTALIPIRHLTLRTPLMET